MFEPRTKAPLFDLPKYGDHLNKPVHRHSRSGTADDFLKLSSRYTRDSGDIYKKVDRKPSAVYSDAVLYARNLELAGQEIERLTRQLADSRAETSHLTANLAKSDQVMVDYKSRLEASEDLREKACRTTVKQMDVIHTLLDEQKTLLARIDELERQLDAHKLQDSTQPQGNKPSEGTPQEPQAEKQTEKQTEHEQTSQDFELKTQVEQLLAHAAAMESRLAQAEADAERKQEQLQAHATAVESRLIQAETEAERKQEELQAHAAAIEARITQAEADARRKENEVNTLQKKLQRAEHNFKKAKKQNKKAELAAQVHQPSASPEPQTAQLPSPAPQAEHAEQMAHTAGSNTQFKLPTEAVFDAPPRTPSLERFPSPTRQSKALQMSSPSPSEDQLVKVNEAIKAAIEPLLEKLESQQAQSSKQQQELASDNALHREAIVAALQEELLKTQDDPAQVMRFVEPLLGPTS